MGQALSNSDDISPLEGDTTELYYQWKKLEAIPQEALQNKNLISLVLDFNNITSIPPEIKNLVNLQELSIAANLLTSIPPEISKLANLRDLNLGLNKFESFDGSFLSSLLNLTQLHLSSDSVSSLPNLSKLKQLKQISLSDNLLGPFFQQHQDYFFPPSLSTINLSQNSLLVSPFFSNAIASLTSIDLSENKITELPDSFAGIINLERLFLGGNHLSSFPKGFNTAWKNLKVLSIPFNNFSILPNEMVDLTSLKTLDIRGNGLQCPVAPLSVKHLLSLLAGDTTIPLSDREAVIDYEDELPDEITPNLYLGCVQAARNKFVLKKLGITHVLTVAQFKPYYPDLFTYKVVDIDDVNSADILSHFEPCVKYIDDALASGGKVLVHCRAGVSRSASVVSAYIMHKQNLNRDAGLEYVRTRRARILPNNGFYNQLGEWQSHLAELRAT